MRFVNYSTVKITLAIKENNKQVLSENRENNANAATEILLREGSKHIKYNGTVTDEEPSRGCSFNRNPSRTHTHFKLDGWWNNIISAKTLKPSTPRTA